MTQLTDCDKKRLKALRCLHNRIALQVFIIWAQWVVIVILVLILGFCDARATEDGYRSDPVFDGKVAAAAEYIASVNPNVDAEAVATELVQASLRANLGEPGNFWLLVALARYESTFDPNAVGDAGERGLLQLHPVHWDEEYRRRLGLIPVTPPLVSAGLTPDNFADCTLYAAIMLSTSIAKGKSLAQALRPWTPRKRVLRLYWELKGER